LLLRSHARRRRTKARRPDFVKDKEPTQSALYLFTISNPYAETMGLRGPKPKRKEVTWSPDLAYGIGLMASDGCLSSDGRHLTFVSKDIDQIETLKKCFGVTAKIGSYAQGRSDPRTACYRVQWGDVVLYTFLLSIGLTPNKSLTLGVVRVSDTYFFDYLRGAIDGDGCFYSYFDPRWPSSFMFYLTIVSGSRAHIEWLRETARRLANVHGHVTSARRTPHIQQLKYAKAESLVLLNLLYKNPEAPCLKRKKLKIEDALRIVGKSLPTH